jgi:putative transposase
MCRAAIALAASPRDSSESSSVFQQDGHWGTARGTWLEAGKEVPYAQRLTKCSPFEYFKTSPEIIRLAVMMYVRFLLSLRNVEDLLHERGVDVSYEAVRYWGHRFEPMFAADIRKRRIEGMRSSKCRWHLDEMFVMINGERHYLRRAVDNEGDDLESFVTKTRDTKAATFRYKIGRSWKPIVCIRKAHCLLQEDVQL